MTPAPTGAGPGRWSGSVASAKRTAAMLVIVVALGDAVAPANLPISVLYVMPIMLTVWLRSRRALDLVAGLCTLLTLAMALTVSGEELPRINALAAAGVTLFAVWTTWSLCRTWLVLRSDLEAGEALRRRTVENLAEGVVTVDGGGRVRTMNPAAEEMTDWTVDEALGRPVDEVVRRELDVTLLPEDRVAPGRGEVLVARGGQTRPIEVSEAELDEGHVLVLRDAAEQRDREGAMLRLAYRDRLTGLPNRASMLDRLQLELAHTKRKSDLLGMLFLDLDGLKTVNDTHGHLAGDALLVGVAERLRSVLREADTVARLGGDEFTVLLPGLEQAEAAMLVAEKVLVALERPILFEGEELLAGASIGLALFPVDAEDGEQLLERADAAMYVAKKEGGRRCRRWADGRPVSPAP